MRIYPSPHKIKVDTSKTIDKDLNIPIAYINTETQNYDITYNVSNDYSIDSRVELIPGQEFDTLDIKVFNKYDEEVDIQDMFVRTGDKYIYRPNKSLSFKPQTFLYKTTIRKSLEYSSSKTYNINALCIDDPDSLDLSQRLSTVLLNPSDRKLLPFNISINKNKENISALNTGTLKDCDCLFIESPNGVYYDDNSNEDRTKIDFDELFLYNSNIWLSLEDHDVFTIYSKGVLKSTELKDPIVLNNKTIEYKEYFDYNEVQQVPGIIYHNIFKDALIPVLIAEHIGKGFIIYSGHDVLKNPEQYRSLIYEAMIYCYLNSYQSSESIKEWIADEVPDYQVKNNRLIKKNDFSSATNLYNLFKLKDNEMQLVNVEILDDPNAYRTAYADNSIDLEIDNTSNIRFTGFKSGHLIFEKSNVSTRYALKDPQKPVGWASIYNNDEIIYIDNIYYLIEETLLDKVFIDQDNNDFKIKIAPFKKSLKNINYTNVIDIDIPMFKTEEDGVVKIRSANYYIYMSNNKIEFVDELDYNDKLGDLLFVVNITQNTDLTTIYDMRQLGGGLPEDMDDNYELLDIGHINGRPYRKNSTIVIKLPLKYKEHEELILKAVNKFISAEEYPVIFFEDNEE